MRKFRLLILVFLIALLTSVKALGQNITLNGQINTYHFSINEYGSAGQIWTGLQAANGNLLFGNRQDILMFNGVEWSKIKTDSEKTSEIFQENSTDTYVSKLYLASNDKVYVGRDNNFGYLDYSSKGELVYFPIFYGGNKNNIGQVWNVFELGNNSILFSAEKGIYVLKDKKVTRLEIPAGFENFTCKTSCRALNGFLFIYQNNDDYKSREEKYLYYDLVNFKLKEISVPKHIQIKNVRGSFQIDNIWYIRDAKDKLFSVYQTSAGQTIWDNIPPSKFPVITKYFSSSITKYGNYLLNNTENNGLVIGDLSGKIIREYSLKDELANLTINHSFFDKNNNLWLCLGNGIQFYETGSPLSYYKKNEGVNSQIESIDFGSGIPLIGTHNGLLTTKVVDGLYGKYTMKSISDLDEIVFDIETVHTRMGKKSMIIGYNGFYEYSIPDNKTKSASGLYAFAFEKDPENPNSIYFTLEKGIARLELQADKTWKYIELIEDAGGETVSLAYLKGKIYFSIRSKGLGVYDLKTKKIQTYQVDQLNKEDQKNNFYVEVFQNEVYLGTANGLFVFDQKTNKLIPFEPEKKLHSKGAKNTIHRIVNIDDNQMWVVVYKDKKGGEFENIIGWFEKRGKEWIWISWPLAGLKNAGLAFAIEKNPAKNEIWIGATDGLFVLNIDAIRKNRFPYKVQVNRMEVNGKIFIHNVSKAEKMNGLDYNQNSFKFYFNSNSFSSIYPTTYSYKLEGFSDEWSQWSSLYFANFEKIPEGKYTFKVKARSAYGLESDVFEYEIKIFPPWYRTVWAYIFYFIVLIVLIYLVVQLALQRVKKQNQKLEETVQERTKEIAAQNQLLEHQKEEIMTKTMDILDSIHYAKRIQTTILPTESRLKEMFEQHFVFYRPKDIVSGDFYWAKEKQGKLIFSAVDCTGHGVPGALVSIVGNNGLLRATNEFRLVEPHEILDKLREIVIKAFRAEGETDVKDGMDIALCSIDKEKDLLKFSGANNECVIIRKGEIIELKPDKQPIGQFIDAKPFSQKEFQLEDGDCIYLYTDGYVDQFGGERLKKFKSKPFKALLATIYQLTMQEQYIKIQQAFDEWKLDVEQVDDVCVFAVKYIKK